MVKGMRDDKKFLNGDEIDGAPEIFIGAAAESLCRTLRMASSPFGKKVSAGADFIQTQCIYDMKRFREWMKQAKPVGADRKRSLFWRESLR